MQPLEPSDAQQWAENLALITRYTPCSTPREVENTIRGIGPHGCKVR